MSSSATSRVFAIGFAAAGLAAILGGCSTDDGGGIIPGNTAGSPGFSGSGSNTAGSTSMSGSPGIGGSGAGASSTAGAAPVGGMGGASSGGGPMGGSSGSGGGGGGAPTNDVTKVWKSDGCGKPAPAGGKVSIGTMGTKDAQCAAALGGKPRCGPWGQPTCNWVDAQDNPVEACKSELPRDHFLYLPDNYDNNKAYPLVLLGPGCGAPGSEVYDYNDNAGNSIIRVGVSPANAQLVGHGTNPGQGCFDDKEGDDSIDFVHYEKLYDKLNAEVCFDRNRVFAGGNSSGAWWSNELGCKYAGDATRPMRGIFPNTGGLPSETQWKPTCSGKPISGIWVHSTGDMTNPFSGNKYAIGLHMAANNCGGNNYDGATLENYDVPGRPAGECKKIAGCPELYPLIVCALNLGNEHGSHDPTVNNTVSFFLQNIVKPPFLTP
jgi:hypothetical protein